MGWKHCGDVLVRGGQWGALGAAFLIASGPGGGRGEGEDTLQQVAATLVLEQHPQWEAGEVSMLTAVFPAMVGTSVLAGGRSSSWHSWDEAQEGEGNQNP